MIGILLAAGRGTRMKSLRPKVLFEVNDEPLCFAPFKALLDLCERVVVVVGYHGGDVREALMQRASEVVSMSLLESKVVFVTQEPPSGTGDAVKVALESIKRQGIRGDETLVLNGDLPLIQAPTLRRFSEAARKQGLHAACLSQVTRNPKGLGRILRAETGIMRGIREEKDASPDERRIQEINGGVYFFETDYLHSSAADLKKDNKQGEFYLTDLLAASPGRGIKVEALLTRSKWDLLGVNTTFELAGVRRIAQMRLQRKLCEEYGVEFADTDSTWISARARFHGSCRLGPGVVVKGPSDIREGVEIEGNSLIDNCQLDEGAKILWGSVLRSSKVGSQASVGPMAHLRPETDVGAKAKVGNFVELKNTKLGAGAKAAHLSYLGDAEVGEQSNIGCGTITCNYDGFGKHRTIIGKGVFVGSDTQLLAPISVGDGAYIGSGTTVTADVPAGALALSRTRMLVKEGYAKRLSEKLAARKERK